MLQSDLKHLPTSEELPSSDYTPVDNEDQNFLPNVLLFMLRQLWAERMDWYFGVDMGIYYIPEPPYVAIIPDGFLSLGVQRRQPKRKGRSRLSYVLWEENNIPPILVLELVSETYGAEYDKKMDKYTQLGALYYVIYNPEHHRRDQHQPFEVYKLVDGRYQLQTGEPFWMPEVGLGIGRYEMDTGGLQQEGLAWFNQPGDRYLTADEQVGMERQRADQEQQKNDRLRAQLRLLGVDPEQLE
jgi:Uma2 family endonuclease